MRKKSLIVSISCIFIILLLAIITHKFHIHYYLTSTLIVLVSMVPVFFSFENRKPDSRELVIIAVITAIAVVSRVAFVALPTIKPVIAIIMLAGFAFGPQVGFLCGSATALVSNFMFSQGAWTPWQMLAYGLAGAIAGILAKGKLVTGKNRITSAISGFLVVMLFVGPVLDLGSAFIMSNELTLKRIILFLGSGLSMNIPLAISTAVTLLLITGSMMRKFERVQIKYGVFK